MVAIDVGEVAIPLWQIALALGWSTEVTVARFCRCNWAFQVGGTGSWFIYSSVLESQMFQVYDRWRDMSEAGAFRRSKKSHPGKAGRKSKDSKDSKPREV